MTTLSDMDELPVTMDGTPVELTLSKRTMIYRWVMEDITRILLWWAVWFDFAESSQKCSSDVEAGKHMHQWTGPLPEPITYLLTHWGRVTHICVGKPTIIGSDNGLSPDRRQAIIWTNAGILLIGALGTYFGEILTGIQTFSFKKMHLKMASAKWRPFCLGLSQCVKVTLEISNEIQCGSRKNTG